MDTETVNRNSKYESSYASQFLTLKCSGDILNILNPINNPEKEISESMAMISELRRFALSKPMHYTLVDACAGNALTSTTAIHLLPFKNAIAIDRKKRARKWDSIRRFDYMESDIDVIREFRFPFILSATHACGDLAHKIIDLYHITPSCEGLVLMPCCVGSFKNKIPSIFSSKMGRYITWAYDLMLSSSGEMHIDKKCLSPCNALVVASYPS